MSDKVEQLAKVLCDVELYDYYLTDNEARYLAQAAIKAMDEDRDREIMERLLELDGLRGRVTELEAENAKLREVLGRASSPVHDTEVVRELLAGGRYHRDPWHPPECGGFQGSGD